MQKLARFLQSAETAVAGVATVAMVCCVLWGVTTRYVTAQPAVWTAELSGILFTWVVFIGATSAFQSDRHVRVTLLVDSLPTAAGRVVRVLAELFVLLFLVYAAWLSFVMMGQGATRPSPALRIPFSYVYLAPLIAFSLMALNAALRLFGWVDAVAEPDVEALP